MSYDTGREPVPFIPGFARLYEKIVPLSWLLVRVAVGAQLAWHGFGKIGRTAGPNELLKKMPELAPMGAKITFVLMLVEMVGGIGVTLGLFTRFCAAAAAVEMAVLTFYIYWPNGWGWRTDGIQFTLMWGMVLFAVALRGGGPYSLDRLIGREL
jgi:putative oxidoreductase